MYGGKISVHSALKFIFLSSCLGSISSIPSDEGNSTSTQNDIKNVNMNHRNMTKGIWNTGVYNLPPQYNKWLRPIYSDTDARVHSSVGILIHAVRNVDEVNEEITLELDLKVRWRDGQIQQYDTRSAKEIKLQNSVPYTYLESSFLDNIWWPSIIFNDVVSITNPTLHTTLHPNPVQLRIYANGLMQMITRLVIKLNCPMDFRYYPADTQTVKSRSEVVRIKSDAASNNEILLNWNDVTRTVDNKIIDYDVFLADRTDGSFIKSLHSINTIYYRHPLEQIESPESYTILEFSICVKRKLSFHMMQTFVPSVFLIAITWLSFFLPMEMLEARIGITMTTLLTLTAMFSSIKEYTPNVSYIKAIDIWMLFCITLVFVTLLEFAILVSLRITVEKNMKRRIGRSLLNTVIIRMRPNLKQTLNRDLEDREADGGGDNEKYSQRNKKLSVYKTITKAADMYGLGIVIGIFVVFNIIFWPILLLDSARFSCTANLDNNAEL